jgi:hypothetical protein
MGVRTSCELTVGVTKGETRCLWVFAGSKAPDW